MNRFGRFVVFAFLAFEPQLPAQAQDVCDADTLPSQAKLLVSKTFPGWRLKRTSDLEGYDRELWTKAHPKECPGITEGHFELPDKTAYALILIPNSDAEAGYKIVVLNRTSSAAH